MLVITSDGDFHAAVFQRRFNDRTDRKCHIFNADTMGTRDALAWLLSPSQGPHLKLRDNDGEEFDLGDVAVIWWRRFNADPKLPGIDLPIKEFDLVRNDSRAATLGSILTCFQGTWINHPFSTRNAENKLLQLRAAQLAGFRVPETLVSNCPEEVRQFCQRLKGQVIVKAVRGTKYFSLFTRQVTEEHLRESASIRMSPAIYQEMIPGEAHLRVHCFGDDIISVQIESTNLDWRENLEVPFRVVETQPSVAERLLKVLAILKLRMGIFDLKLLPGGEPVWLEVNSQGQFLFSEGLTGVNLMERFVDFILRQCEAPAGLQWPAAAY